MYGPLEISEGPADNGIFWYIEWRFLDALYSVTRKLVAFGHVVVEISWLLAWWGLRRRVSG